ncbi:hypothetical protein [Cellulosilyticum lentocellum]|uniref:Uncharacterized protein n=1 Tax=Cellulosilyticum lentocellum (strain ATCC 49066 / DSM 5427 / NCIMB 11756 / RHM5) TaxID=642492 RepID=F2JNA1_CELLD|nr:hypothetical protein [Cellulosilyticum lentocellum]ADZ83555.1 hypothetical protein Clole_1832 [Cellulosilyticum lentocellum DSM 5427]
MSDPHKATDELLIWAAEVAEKADCNTTLVVANFYEENKKPGRTVEQLKVVVENNLINGVNHK